jgi:hypothetical protein
MTEINGVLKKYGRILSPKVIMTMAGMQFSIEVVAAQLSAPTPGNLGKVGTPDA